MDHDEPRPGEPGDPGPSSSEPQVPEPQAPEPQAPDLQAAATSETPGMGVPTGIPGGFGDAGGADVEAPRGSRGARLTALVTAVVLVIGGAAIGVVLSGGGDGVDLETVVPANAIVFAKANLAPPGDQRANLQAILERFPPPEGKTPGDAFRDFLDDGFGGANGSSFTDDVLAWIGDEVGVVLTGLDLSSGQPRYAVVAAVRDEARARAALTRFEERGNPTGGGFVFEVREGVAFIAQELLSMEAALAAVDGRAEPLSANAEFTTALDQVGGDNLGMLWFDGRSLAQLIPPEAIPSLPGGMANVNGTGLIVLRAERDAVIIEGSGTEPATAGGSGVPALVESSSADQIGSLTLFDPAAFIDQMIGFADLAFGGFGSSGSSDDGVPAETRDVATAWLQTNLGLDLDDDILPWMHGELSVIVGSVALPSPDVGVVIESTDDEAARRTIDALATRLGAVGRDQGFEVTPAPGGFAATTEQGITIVVRRIAGRVVVAASDAYADELLAAAPQALAEDAVYRRSVGDPGTEVAFQLFVRLDRIVTLARAFGGDEAASAQRYLDSLGSFGLRAGIEDGRSNFRMVVTFK